MSQDYDCAACKVRIKTWNGSDPKCAFTTGIFNGSENWNCATVNQIRIIAKSGNVTGVKRSWSEDQNYSTIVTNDINDLVDEDNVRPVCLWVGWYKNRGRTEGMWLMFENLPPREPTEAECLMIIKEYQKKGVQF